MTGIKLTEQDKQSLSDYFLPSFSGAQPDDLDLKVQHKHPQETCWLGFRAVHLLPTHQEAHSVVVVVLHEERESFS